MLPKGRYYYPAQQGFSLLEILVAFAILALAIGVLLNIFSRGLRTAIVSEEYQQAVAIAETQLARAGVDIELEAGRAVTGQVGDKYTWIVSASPYELAPTKSKNNNVVTQQPEVNAFAVQVQVYWQEGTDNKSVVLDSIRLAKIPQP